MKEDTKNQSIKWKLKILITNAKKKQVKKSILGRGEDNKRSAGRWRRKEVTALIQSPPNIMKMVKLTV